MGIKKLLAGLSTAGLLLSFGMPLTAFAAASTVVVTPTKTQGWSTEDTRPGGAVNFITDNTSPLPTGALQLTTDATTTSKAQYLHAASNPLSAVTDLSYSTKQVAGPPEADAAYQLPIFLNGTSGFTTLVFEPYQNTAQGAITQGIWQSWDVDQGLFWSTRTVTCSNGTINGTSGGPASYTLAQIKAACPQASVLGFGVNIGSNNPSYNVEVDKLVYNETTFNFEAKISTVNAPSITSPANNSTLTSSQLNKIDFTDSTTTGNGPIKYQYRAYSDAAYTTLVYDSGPTLTSSEILTPGTPEGTYYVQVRAVDADGITSAWSNDATTPFKITVRNSPTTVQQCLNGGFSNFANPTFSNLGQCISFVFSSRGGSSTSFTVRNNNKVTVTNSTTQTSVSGNSSTSTNTIGGSATSGNASNTSNTTTSVVLLTNVTY